MNSISIILGKKRSHMKSMILLCEVQNQAKISHAVEVKTVVTFERKDGLLAGQGMSSISGVLTKVCFMTR